VRTTVPAADLQQQIRTQAQPRRGESWRAWIDPQFKHGYSRMRGRGGELGIDVLPRAKVVETAACTT
jgi:hypothetical protein